MKTSQFHNFSSKEFGSRIESTLRLLQNEKCFCDVTIACEGRSIDAHKAVLARGSRIFNNILKLNPQSHPLIFLNDVKFSYLLNILDYMYQGEVSIDKRELDGFLRVARDLEVNDLTEETFKDSKEYNIDRSKKQRLGSSPKQQFNLDYKIKIDNNLDDSRIVVNDLKIDELEDFEQFADEDFDDESEGVTIKDGSFKQNLNVEYKIKIEVAHDLEVNDFNKEALEDSKVSIEDKSKKQRLGSSPKQQLNLDYKIKTDDESEGMSIKKNLMDSSPKQDLNVEYTIKIEKENKSSEKNEKFISTQDPGKEPKLLIRDIAKLSGNEKTDSSKEKLKTHRGIRYPCSQCDYKATRKGDLKKHVLSVHEGIRYPCSHCDYKATTKGHLKTHLSSIHEGIRHGCSQCDYKATTKGNLKNHILSVHEGIRYPCSQCDYKATLKGDLNKHVLSIHEGIQHACSQCDYKGNKGNLKNHILSVHEGIRYSCSHCDFKGSTKGHLKTHVLSIHGGIRYPCSQCDYKATLNGDLRKHILSIHEGKTYPCSHCNYEATQKSSLKTHINKHHL